MAIASDPYIPTNDNEVLETLPTGLRASWDEVSALRSQLSADPTNVEKADAVAGRFIQMAKRSGDPRFYGYARAALAPWWDNEVPPPAIIKLRAKINESDHFYDLALADLQLLLKQQPNDIQTWIEVCNLQRVQGKYAEAMKSSATLSEMAADVPATMSSAPILAVTGHADEAYAQLEKILPIAKDKWSGTVQWIITRQAEIAWALGRDEQAERHFREAISNDASDYYLLRAYSDFLMDRGRAAEVVPLVREHLSDTGVLLAAAIAASKTGDKVQAEKWTKELEDRFTEIRQRGAEPHLRYEARYFLELKNDPKQALALALGNWKNQKETRDTRTIFEAAIAAGDPAAAEAAVAFLRDNHTENVVLQKLAAQLEPIPPLVPR